MMNSKKTKIVCTLGPASDKEEVLRELIINGLNVCRFNFSHGSHEEHKCRMDIVKKVRKELDKPIAILLDTKGPEIRTGAFELPEVLLKEGKDFIITMKDVIGTEEICTVSYKGLAKDVKSGDVILIDDGLVALRVKQILEDDIYCVVENSGIVKNHKGVNVPGVKINLPALTDKDISDIKFGIEQGIDFIAASFVRKAEICTVSYKGLAKDVKSGDVILIDDGLVALRVKQILEDDIYCVVENSGIVKNHKGVNVPGVKINLPALTDKDISDIKFGIEQGIDFIAASFVRKAEDVLAIRKILEENNGEHIEIISKIENQEGIDNIDSIIEVSDGIMVARGDLGVEIPTEEVPIAQKMMIEKCNKVGKPVITATQMLDSMMRNPRPTRAEVTDVANAIYDGTDAIMLSGETAAGKYPIEAVKTMASIAKRTEETLDYKNKARSKSIDEFTITNAISMSTCTTALNINAAAIITFTTTGNTAKMVSRFRPNCPIIATTGNEAVMRRLALCWGVYPVKTINVDNIDEMIEQSIEAVKSRNYVKNGDLVVITAGAPIGVEGTTNLIKVHLI